MTKYILVLVSCFFIMGHAVASLTNYNFPITIKCDNGDGPGVSSFILIRENALDTYVSFIIANTGEIAPRVKIQNATFDWNFSMTTLYPEAGDINARTFISFRTSNDPKVPWFATLTTLDERDMLPNQASKIINEHFDCVKVK